MAVLLGVAAGSIPQKPDSEMLQGNWTGRELGANRAGPRYLEISGTHMEIRGSNPDDWARGTFTLREDSQPKQLLFVIQECRFPKYIGQTSYSIYKLEGGTLSFTGNEPGNPSVPAAFDAPRSRQFEFKKE